MPPKSDVYEYYYRELFPAIEELEQKRLELKNRFLTYGSLFAVLAAMALISLLKRADGTNLEGIVFAVAAVAGVLGFGYRYLQKRFQKQFKTRIFERLITFIDPRLHYVQEAAVPRRRFENSRIFKQNIDRYRGNDHIFGKLGKTQLEFSDLHVQYKTRQKNKTVWHTVFRGIFFTAGFKKHTKGELFVLPDSAERLFGTLGGFFQSINKAYGDLIRLDHPEFEKHFVVYGDDQIHARYILTHTLMEQILHLRRQAGVPIYLSFNDGQVYIAISYGKDSFEPGLFRSLKEFGFIREFVEVLQLCIGVVEQFELNKRLWSKE